MARSELAVGQAGATANAGTRFAAKAEIDDLLRFTISLGNTRSGDKFLYGGDFVDRPSSDPGVDQSAPVDRARYRSADPLDTSVKREPTGDVNVTIGPGFELATAHTGRSSFATPGRSRRCTLCRPPSDRMTSRGSDRLLRIRNAI